MRRAKTKEASRALPRPRKPKRKAKVMTSRKTRHDDDEVQQQAGTQEELEQSQEQSRAPAQRSSEQAQVDYAPLIRLMRNFMGALPTTSSQYTATESDRFHDQEADVPDGLYRLDGTDWLFTIEGKHLKEAQRAAPPDFGGPDVVMVPAS